MREAVATHAAASESDHHSVEDTSGSGPGDISLAAEPQSEAVSSPSLPKAAPRACAAAMRHVLSSTVMSMSKGCACRARVSRLHSPAHSPALTEALRESAGQPPSRTGFAWSARSPKKWSQPTCPRSCGCHHGAGESVAVRISLEISLLIR